MRFEWWAQCMQSFVFITLVFTSSIIFRRECVFFQPSHSHPSSLRKTNNCFGCEFNLIVSLRMPETRPALLFDVRCRFVVRGKTPAHTYHFEQHYFNWWFTSIRHICIIQKLCILCAFALAGCIQPMGCVTWVRISSSSTTFDITLELSALHTISRAPLPITISSERPIPKSIREPLLLLCVRERISNIPYP